MSLFDLAMFVCLVICTWRLVRDRGENSKEAAKLRELAEPLKACIAALEKNKSEWETVSPNSFKHLVAWQMSRDALARLEKVMPK